MTKAMELSGSIEQALSIVCGNQEVNDRAYLNASGAMDEAIESWEALCESTGNLDVDGEKFRLLLNQIRKSEGDWSQVTGGSPVGFMDAHDNRDWLLSF